MGGTCCFNDTTAQNRIPLREYYYSSDYNRNKIYIYTHITYMNLCMYKCVM